MVKADGLAAGKGVTVAETLAEAEGAVDAALIECAFGQAGAEVVIEECLVGEEASVFALVDGATASCRSPRPRTTNRWATATPGPTPAAWAPIRRRRSSPTDLARAESWTRSCSRRCMPWREEGRPFKGVLYAGLMITADGPKVLEFNVRFGDPECQVLMTRLKSDLLPALIATSDGLLESFDLRWHDEAALVVVLAAKGYPGGYQKGTVIRGIEAAEEDEAVTVFHAGTKTGEDGALLANGGRVLGVTALGATVGRGKEQHAYAAVDRIDWPEGFCRRDIGWRAADT